MLPFGADQSETGPGQSRDHLHSSVDHPTDHLGNFSDQEWGESAIGGNRGNGHHSAAAVTAMIYLCCSGLTITLPTQR